MPDLPSAPCTARRHLPPSAPRPPDPSTHHSPPEPSTRHRPPRPQARTPAASAYAPSISPLYISSVSLRPTKRVPVPFERCGSQPNNGPNRSQLQRTRLVLFLYAYPVESRRCPPREQAYPADIRWYLEPRGHTYPLQAHLRLAAPEAHQQPVIGIPPEAGAELPQVRVARGALPNTSSSVAQRQSPIRRQRQGGDASGAVAQAHAVPAPFVAAFQEPDARLEEIVLAERHPCQQRGRRAGFGVLLDQLTALQLPVSPFYSPREGVWWGAVRPIEPVPERGQRGGGLGVERGGRRRWALLVPVQPVYTHQAGGVLRVPGVVDDVLLRVVRGVCKRGVAGPDYLSRSGAQELRPAGVSLGDERSQRVIRDDVGDAVVGFLPGAAAIEAVIGASALADEWTFHGVPVPHPPVPHPLPLVELPARVRPHNGRGFPREPGHTQEPVDHDPRADALASLGIQEVAAVVEVPLPVVLAERVGVYRERLLGREHHAAVLERPCGVGGGRHAQPVALPLTAARGVVHVERAVVVGYLRRPEGLEGVVVQGEGDAERTPAHEVPRMRHRDNKLLRSRGGSVGIVLPVVLQDERVAQVAAMDRVGVGPFANGDGLLALSARAHDSYGSIPSRCLPVALGSRRVVISRSRARSALGRRW